MNPGDEGPKATAAEAYDHGAELAEEIARKARRRDQFLPVSDPCYVRVEEVEHLARGLRGRAEQAEAQEMGRAR